MKMLLNKDWGGFGVKEETLKRLGLTNCYSHELRTNPILIAIVEAGENIDGPNACLEVREIPDNTTDWDIVENDGWEDLVYVVNGKIRWA